MKMTRRFASHLTLTVCLPTTKAEREYQKEGSRPSKKLELEKAQTPHAPGPLMDLFAKLSKFQRLDSQRRGKSDPYFKPAIRISIVTSRGAQSEERLITTLKNFWYECGGALSSRWVG